MSIEPDGILPLRRHPHASSDVPVEAVELYGHFVDSVLEVDPVLLRLDRLVIEALVSLHQVGAALDPDAPRLQGGGPAAVPAADVSDAVVVDRAEDHPCILAVLDGVAAHGHVRVNGDAGIDATPDPVADDRATPAAGRHGARGVHDPLAGLEDLIEGDGAIPEVLEVDSRGGVSDRTVGDPLHDVAHYPHARVVVPRTGVGLHRNAVKPVGVLGVPENRGGTDVVALDDDGPAGFLQVRLDIDPHRVEVEDAVA